MNRIFHHYNEWECWKNGMYKTPMHKPEHEIIIKKAAALLSSQGKLEKAMRKVIDKWALSAEHHMSDTAINRQAWLGQAACCLTEESTEGMTKEAWRTLNPEKQRQANRVADKCIAYWENKQKGKDEPCLSSDWV